MKVNSLIAKTALAAAIASVSYSALADDLTIANPSVVAVELFTGDAASDQTSVTLPTIEFKAADRTANVFTAADNNTIKLTLAATHAVFSSDFNTPSAWAGQGVKIVLDATGTPVTLDQNNVVGVDAGTQGNNVIIIRVDSTVDLTKDISIKGLKVWNLRKTHNVVDGTTSVNMELTGSAAGEYATSEDMAAIYTAKGVALTGKASNYNGGASSNRGYIEVDSGQTKFTDAITGFGDLDNPAGAPHRDVFDAAYAVEKLYFGELNIARGTVKVNGADKEAGNEHGTKFQISGGDTVALTLSTDGADLRDYGLGLYNAADCTGSPLSTVAYTDNSTAKVTLTGGVSLDSATPYHLCAVVPAAGAANALPTLNSLNAAISVKYTNVRYGDSTGSADFGKVLRNGCSVTLFNLPHVNANDSAMIRFTNTSSDETKKGEVIVTVWGEDGKQLDQSVQVLDNLDAHATAILHTNSKLADTENRVYLGDALPKFGASKGRSRIIIDGAFPSCEALGMIRSENGTLVNMSSTVYSGSENNTSNTAN